MKIEMDTAYYVQHLQCPRERKLECFETVHQLVELAFAVREHGLLKLDEMIKDNVRFSDPFLRKAANLVTDISNPDKVRKVLHNYIYASNLGTTMKFFKCIVITETMIAISQMEDMDYLFTYFVPSFFGLEFEAQVVKIYRDFRRSRIPGAKDEDETQPETDGSVAEKSSEFPDLGKRTVDKT